MFIYQLLFALVFNDHGKIIKTANQPANLETVYQIDDNSQIFVVLLEVVLFIDLYSLTGTDSYPHYNAT